MRGSAWQGRLLARDLTWMLPVLQKSRLEGVAARQVLGDQAFVFSSGEVGHVGDVR